MPTHCDPRRNLWSRRSDLTGVSLRGINHETVVSGPEKELFKIEGQLFGELKKIMNFTYRQISCQVLESRHLKIQTLLSFLKL